jgi:hypothetical protein
MIGGKKIICKQYFMMHEHYVKFRLQCYVQTFIETCITSTLSMAAFVQPQQSEAAVSDTDGSQCPSYFWSGLLLTCLVRGGKQL